MAQTQQNNLDVSVMAGIDGTDRITLRAGDTADAALITLTPSQARLLATELIAAVNRAEVKASLKVGNNMWRRPGDARPRFIVAG